MKASPTLLALLALLAAACQQDVPLPSSFVHGAGLVGNWQLVQLQCECVPGPVPDENLVLTDSTADFYRNNVRDYLATYRIGNASLCGSVGPVSALLLQPTTATTGMPTIAAGYILRGDTLVLDFGSPCDGPRKTYRRAR